MTEDTGRHDAPANARKITVLGGNVVITEGPVVSVAPRETAPNPGMFRNWGDHPVILGVSLLLAIIGAAAAVIGAAAAVFQAWDRDKIVQSSPGPTASPDAIRPSPTPTPLRQWVADRSPNSAELTDIGIAVAVDGSGWSAPAAAEIAKAIADQRAGVRVVYMTEAFVRDGAFASLFAGDRIPLERVNLSRYVDWLLLVKLSSACGAHPTYANIRTCRASAEGRYVDARTGAITHPMNSEAASSGRSTTEAQAQTWERIAGEIAADAP